MMSRPRAGGHGQRGTRIRPDDLLDGERKLGTHQSSPVRQKATLLFL
jgi:hypothetical protein